MLNLNRFVNRSFLRTVEEYGKSLASDRPADLKETEKCHLAKLVLISPSQSELRVTSLKTLADLGSKSLIPHLLREITLLTRKHLSEHASQMILDLYSILNRDCNPPSPAIESRQL